MASLQKPRGPLIMSEFKRVTVLIVNDHFDDNGKASTQLFRLINDVCEGQMSCFTMKAKQKPLVGCVYTVIAKTCQIDGHIETLKPDSFQIGYGTFSDESYLREIQLKQRAESTLANAKRQAIKDSKSDELILDCMKPLRQAYKKTNRQGQMAIEVRLLNFLRYGGDL